MVIKFDHKSPKIELGNKLYLLTIIFPDLIDTERSNKWNLNITNLESAWQEP